MAPKERIRQLREIANVKNSGRKAGVLALFYPSKCQQTMLALILRKTYNGVHSAQIGFPGGKLEPTDGSLKNTALRETEEEIGVKQNKVVVLKKLLLYFFEALYLNFKKFFMFSVASEILKKDLNIRKLLIKKSVIFFSFTFF